MVDAEPFAAYRASHRVPEAVVPRDGRACGVREPMAAAEAVVPRGGRAFAVREPMASPEAFH